MTLSNSARRRPLTRNELQALFYAAQSALHRPVSRTGRGALGRAMEKITEQMSQERRDGIERKGARDARKGQRDPSYKGDRLGSMETMTYDHAFNPQRG